MEFYRLVTAEDIAGVNLVLHVVEGGGVAVGDYGGGLVLEGGKVVYYLAAEEGGAVGERRFVDDYVCALGLDALHDALDCRLAEIVAVRLHRQAINTDCHRRLLGYTAGRIACARCFCRSVVACCSGSRSTTCCAISAVLVLGGVVVPAGATKDGVGDVVLAGAV